MEKTPLSVSDAIALINQTLEYAYPTIVVDGEVSSFKVNQNKYVFFDIKDDDGTLGCFMMVYALRVPIEDGMRVRVIAQPKLTQWGKFSLTVREIQPIGEGSLRRSFELLLKKLDKEGLFAADRKRPLPVMPQRVGVISSTQAAGYADFIEILNQRWGGVEVIVAHTAVQGAGAPQQMIRAIEHFNQMSMPPDVIAIIRGGGSLDDLSAFNDEPLVRAIAASRVPIITGIGHEVDTSLADLAADVRAATPSNAAQLIVPDKQTVSQRIDQQMQATGQRYYQRISRLQSRLAEQQSGMMTQLTLRLKYLRQHVQLRMAVLKQLDPQAALRRGYSLMYDEKGRIATTAQVGDTIIIETRTSNITAGVTHVKNK